MIRVLTLFTALGLLACGGNSQQPVEASNSPNAKVEAQVIKYLNPADYATLLAQYEEATVLDVRTPQEVAEGVIECAQNIDFYDNDFRDRVKKLDHDKPIFVYCAVGGRSGQATDFMKRDGFREVYNLDGGIRAWVASGRKAETCEND